MEQDKIIQNAQFRKGLSISFFNSTNSAIEMVKLEGLPKAKKTKGKKKAKNPTLADRIEFWRNYFLEKHKEYYANVIANVGVAYKPEDSIAKLKKARTLEELQGAWRMLSADERADGEIRAVVQELKTKFTTNEKA